MRRRNFLHATVASGGAATTLGLAPPAAAQIAAAAGGPSPSAPTSAPPGRVAVPPLTSAERLYVFFKPDEAPAIEALVNRLVPEDDLSPSGVDLGIVWFLDRQLAGAFGQGAKTYRMGPWQAGSANQGYQLPFAPAELYRQALADLATVTAAEADGASFDQLSPDRQDALLVRMEAGQLAFATVPSKTFFETLRDNVIEGLFCDPAYGGNRGMAGWAMIGFPGVQVDWSAGFQDWRDKRVDLPPQSMADNL